MFVSGRVNGLPEIQKNIFQQKTSKATQIGLNHTLLLHHPKAVIFSSLFFQASSHVQPQQQRSQRMSQLGKSTSNSWEVHHISWTHGTNCSDGHPSMYIHVWMIYIYIWYIYIYIYPYIYHTKFDHCHVGSLTRWWLNPPMTWKICASQILFIFPKIGMNIKKIWNHHLVSKYLYHKMDDMRWTWWLTLHEFFGKFFWENKLSP